MTLRIKLSHLVVGLVVGTLLVGAGYALATTRNSVIHACVNPRTRALTVPAHGRCTRGLKALSWNQRGPRGARGARGFRGARGSRGASGSAGTPASVSIGSVTTESAGSPATVTNSGSGSNAVLNFGIPQGAAGLAGGSTGPNAYGEVWVGTSTAQLATGLGVETVSGGAGSVFVKVTNCTAATPTEPIILVTPNKDSSDSLPGANTSTSGQPTVYVSSFGDGSAPGDHVLTFTVQLDSTGDEPITTDFAFTATC